MPITKATASSIAPAAKGDLVVGSATNDASVLAVGSANQVLTVDSSTTTGLKWAAPSAGALTLINATTFSAVASQSINSVFSGTYENYKIIMKVTSSAANVELQFRYRVSGTDVTTNYRSALFQIGSGNTTQTLGGATTYIDFGNMRGSSIFNGYDVTVYFPNTSGRRPLSFTGWNGYGDPGTDGAYWGAGDEIGGGAAYDGFTLLASTGTISGTVRTYGLANS